MTVEINEALCPLCQQENSCLNVKFGSSDEQCWCASGEVSFLAELLEQVPKEKQGKACICRSCAENAQAK